MELTWRFGINNMIKRKQSYENQIIFIDGMWSSAKSLLGPLISGFDNVEKWKIDPIFEYICVMHFLDEISLENSSELSRLLGDKASFESFISREVNLRWHEETSIFKNPNAIRYIQNLFKKDDGSFNDQLIRKKPSLNIMTHNILQISYPLINAFQERLKLIVVEKHPVYFMDYWEKYLSRIGNDPKELTLTYGLNGEVPWFIKDELEYLEAKPLDRAIISLRDLVDLKKEIISTNLLDDTNLLIIPFESFVTESDKWIKRISNFLQKEFKIDFSKKLKIPRKHLEDAQSYSASSLKEEKNHFVNLYKKIEAKSSSDYFETLKKILDDYQGKDFGREMPWDGTF